MIAPQPGTATLPLLHVRRITVAALRMPMYGSNSRVRPVHPTSLRGAQRRGNLNHTIGLPTSQRRRQALQLPLCVTVPVQPEAIQSEKIIENVNSNPITTSQSDTPTTFKVNKCPQNVNHLSTNVNQNCGNVNRMSTDVYRMSTTFPSAKTRLPLSFAGCSSPPAAASLRLVA